MERLTCRACLRLLTDPTGCVICQPMKAQLSVEGNAEGDELSLVDIANDAVRLIKAQIDLLKLRVRAGGNQYDAETSDEVQRVAVALSKVLTEVRKTRKEASSAEAGMSFSERAAMVAEWYQGLPPAMQGKVDQMLKSVRRATLSSVQ